MTDHNRRWPSPPGAAAYPSASGSDHPVAADSAPAPVAAVQPAPTHPNGAIRINLVLPVTRLVSGLFTIDPVAQLLGMPLSEVLAPLLVGPVYQQPSSTGTAVDVYPLALPPGEGASIRLGQFGDVGFANDRSLLKLILPLSLAGWMQQRLAHVLVYGPIRGISADRTAYVAEAWLQLRPGMRASLPLGPLGEVGICCE